jgi:hypothetical protein
MDARTYPRRKLSVPVKLHCNDRNCHLQGRAKDISANGMFVIAPVRVQTGWQFDICMSSPGWENEQHINATVQRITGYGFALRFLLDSASQQILEDILQPNWDGDNVYEGLMIFAERENVVDFSEWLRLTSLVCNQYRRCARARTLSKSNKTHEH